MLRPRILVAAALALGLVSACERVIEQHGYAPASAELAQIRVGQDTRASVRRKIGRPSGTGIFLPDRWYYVASEVENYLFYAPRVASRRVVAVRFDEADRVASVNEYGLEDGRVIDLETRTTPTLGRELTILQQVLGNLGRISAEELSADE